MPSAPAVKFTETIWRKVKVEGNTPPPRRYHSGVLYDGKLWVFAGSKGRESILADLWVLDLSTKTWEEIKRQEGKPWPAARQAHSAVVYGDGMFVFGGIADDNHSSLSDTWVFEFQTQEWKQITAPVEATPAGRFHHAVVFIPDRKAFWILGGSQTIKIHCQDIWEFRLESYVWKKLDLNLPSARSGLLPMYDELNKNLYIYAGYEGDGGFTYLNDSYALDLGEAELKWSNFETRGTAPYPGRQNTSIYSNEVFWVFGGFDGKHAVSELYYFEPKQLQWFPVSVWMEMDVTSIATSAASMNTKAIPRYGHTLIVEPNADQMLVFGGSGSTYLNDLVEIEIPSE